MPSTVILVPWASLGRIGVERPHPPALHGDAFACASAGGTVLDGVVCVVDHFGNAITTLRETDLRGREVVAVEWEGGGTSRAVRTYVDVEDGLAVLLGTAGHLEVVARGRPSQP